MREGQAPRRPLAEPALAVKRRTDQEGRVLLPHERSFNRDLHFFADEDAASLESLVPAQTEVRPVDLPLGCVAKPRVAPRILRPAFERRVESDLLRDAMHRQIADQL